MKLELDATDLKPEYQKARQDGGVDQACATRIVRFDKLSDEAQAAVRVVGQATFYAWDRQTYNTVYPPE